MTHDERVYHHLYVDSKSPLENAERIAALEELCLHMFTCMEHFQPNGEVRCDVCPLDNDTGNCDFERRMIELGIEVDE